MGLKIFEIYSFVADHRLLSGEAVRHLLPPAEASQPSDNQQKMEVGDIREVCWSVLHFFPVS